MSLGNKRVSENMTEHHMLRVCGPFGGSPSFSTSVPQHRRPMSFFVQPCLQHIPATPREKFLFILNLSCSPKTCHCRVSSGSSGSLSSCCQSPKTPRRATMSARERGGGSRGGEAACCLLSPGSSSVTSPTGLHWSGSGQQRNHDAAHS